MPALSFGLSSSKSKAPVLKVGQKRKNLFGDDEDDSPETANSGTIVRERQLTSLDGFNDEDGSSSRPQKSPKLSHSSTSKTAPKSQKYTNLSSLHSARQQDAQASTLDPSVYDYDGVYETFQAPKAAAESNGAEASGPKYMKSLLASADVRKRDQLRAKEKQLQRERENEGDEFADKEKFVTGAYKAQQEEVKKAEEEEKRKEAEEEERRKKGGGMVGWHREVLRKEEERMKAIEKAASEVKYDATGAPQDEMVEEDEERIQAKTAAKLNAQGANIIVNDEGEVVDKRQLLSAGLNVAKKPQQASAGPDRSTTSTTKDTGFYRSSAAQNARLSQRERQTRMMEAQLEEMTEKTRLAEEEEKKLHEEKAKSTKTEADKMGARERFLARKKEREEEAKAAKAAKAKEKEKEKPSG